MWACESPKYEITKLPFLNNQNIPFLTNIILYLVPCFYFYIPNFFDVWVLLTQTSDWHFALLYTLPSSRSQVRLVGGAYEESLDNFCKRGGDDYTGIDVQYRWAPILSNTQELFELLRNKSKTNNIVYTRAKTENTAIAIPKLDYINQTINNKFTIIKFLLKIFKGQLKM